MKIQDNQKIWFTSDHHFGHSRIIQYSDRPFKNVDEMDCKLVDNWNSLVSPDDFVFHLGDFTFGGVSAWENYRNRLNGDIFLIRGNHDRVQDGQIKHLFKGVENYLEINVRDSEHSSGWQQIVLCHYAFRVWNRSHYGSYHLYGHSHGNLPDDPCSLSFDVGVDCHDYKPISYSGVKKIMEKKNWTK